MKVLTLDPGVTTGYTQAHITKDSVTIKADQKKWDHNGLWIALCWYKPDIVVYEEFDYRRGLGDANLYPKELIGVLHLWVQRTDKLMRVYPQKPARKEEHFKKKETIMEKDLWVPSKPHAMDAMRHFLMWWTFGPGYKFYNRQELSLV